MNKFLLFLFIGFFSISFSTAAVQDRPATIDWDDRPATIDWPGISNGPVIKSKLKLIKRTTSEKLSKEDKAFLSRNKKTAQAYYNLGDYYMRGGEKYYQKASKLFETAAAQGGHAESKYHLGEIYELGGQGIKQDYQEAIKWYTQAAEEGSVRAQLTLGKIYEKGDLGIKQDSEESSKWRRLAAKTKDKNSCATAIGN